MIGIWGANGFIGRHVVQATSGNDLRLFSRNFEGFPFPLPERVKQYCYDFADPNSYIDDLEDCESIILLVSGSHAKTFADHPNKEIETNVVPYKNFFGALQQQKSRPKHIVYVSSGGTVYGPTEHKPVDEAQATAPVSPYGKARLAIENIIIEFCNEHDSTYTIFRAANPVGLWNKRESLVDVALNAVRNQTPMSVYGNGSTIRDYFAVQELAAAITMAISNEFAKNQIYNIGSGTGLTINEVLGIIADVTNENVPVTYKEDAIPTISCNVLDCKKIDKHLGWRANRTLQTIVSDMWNAA